MATQSTAHHRLICCDVSCISSSQHLLAFIIIIISNWKIPGMFLRQGYIEVMDGWWLLLLSVKPGKDILSLSAVAFLTHNLVPGLLCYAVSSKKHTKHRTNIYQIHRLLPYALNPWLKTKFKSMTQSLTFLLKIISVFKLNEETKKQLSSNLIF